MNYDNLKKMAEGIRGDLPTCDLEDLLFMTRTISQTAYLIRDYPDEVEICSLVLEDITIELNNRALNRTCIFIEDNRVFEILEDIEKMSSETLKMLHDFLRKVSQTSKDELTVDLSYVHGEFIEEEMDLRKIPFRRLTAETVTVLDVPSPSEIINGKSPKGIPNN